MTKSGAYAGFIVSILFSVPAFSQYAGDAFRYSEINQTGTARFQGLGGNHAALGGDASSISGNPAGLGFYNRSEFSISPAVTGINTDSKYIDQSGTDNKSNFNIANASLVISSKPGFQRKWKRSSLGVSFSRQQSFQEVYNYSGVNNRSTYLDKVTEDVNLQKVPLADLRADFESNPSNGGPLAYSVPAAYYQMYLINPVDSLGPPYSALDRSSSSNQYGTYSATGANTQWNLAYAGNYDDKFYLGATIGFSRLRYKYSRTFVDNYINSPELVAIQQGEELSVTGNGINLSVGIIYKINPTFQLGGVLTTPTFSSIRETFTQNINAQYVDNLVSDGNGNLITPPYTSLAVAPNEFVYSLTSPFRGSFGATYFFQDKGFITGSLEYVGYSGMGVRTKYNDNTSNQEFKDETKAEIKDSYRNTANLRVGGEFRANLFRARAGIAYLADPYADRSSINRDKLLFSAGVGLRASKYFADITGTLATYKSAFTPYTLSNSEDYSSVQISNRSVNVMLTIGTFF